MRADGEGSSLAEDVTGTTTGGSNPVTTGLTSLSDGGSPATEPSTTAPPSSEVGTDSDQAEDTTGGEAESSGTGAETGDETGDETGSSTTDVDPSEDSVDLSGWTLVQTGSDRVFTLPAGTIIPAGAILVVGRDATRGAFEQHWGALEADVVYLDSEDSFPAINGDETFSIRDASDTVVDGPTPAMASGQTVARTDASAAGSWTTAGEGDADPGVGHPFAGSSGVFLTEVSDATGSGSFVYEFIELQAWP